MNTLARRIHTLHERKREPHGGAIVRRCKHNTKIFRKEEIKKRVDTLCHVWYNCKCQQTITNVQRRQPFTYERLYHSF